MPMRRTQNLCGRDKSESIGRRIHISRNILQGAYIYKGGAVSCCTSAYELPIREATQRRVYGIIIYYIFQ